MAFLQHTRNSASQGIDWLAAQTGKAQLSSLFFRYIPTVTPKRVHSGSVRTIKNPGFPTILSRFQSCQKPFPCLYAVIEGLFRQHRAQARDYDDLLAVGHGGDFVRGHQIAVLFRLAGPGGGRHNIARLYRVAFGRGADCRFAERLGDGLRRGIVSRTVERPHGTIAQHTIGKFPVIGAERCQLHSRMISYRPNTRISRFS